MGASDRAGNQTGRCHLSLQQPLPAKEKQWPGPQQRPGPYQQCQNPNNICRYCNKKGHLQKECFSRQRNNAPMVDAKGKAYENNHVNKVADKPTARQAKAVYEDSHIGSVTNLSPYHHLNW